MASRFQADIDYHSDRAKQERKTARRARLFVVKQAHETLSKLHEMMALDLMLPPS